MLHRMHEIQTIVTNVRHVCQSVSPSVCLSVCQAAQLCVAHSCSLYQITLALCSIYKHTRVTPCHHIPDE